MTDAETRAADSRQDLVLVPGLLCTADLYAAQIADLADVARVTVADISRHPTMAAIAAEVLSRAPARFALAGLSMGGYVAFEILRQAPERVTRLALLDTNARADRPEQARQREVTIDLARTMGVRAVQGLLLRLLIHPSRFRDAPLTARVLDLAEGHTPASFARQQHAIMSRPDNRAFLAQIRCPTLIVVGNEDLLTPPKVAEEMAAGITGSRLVVLPSCGHLSTMERPQAVTQALRDWLAA